ncbi:DEAD/DEAH box helicase [Endozoicomonas atrinae]|uniref:DEAD/DEAH box helicase n=1 Tax=Endozoicomonas atrinae TaxID=1333660 RepID=UPI0008265C5B|nr:AAA domain-containing protein [Endozoicomonas atrinae]
MDANTIKKALMAGPKDLNDLALATGLKRKQLASLLRASPEIELVQGLWVLKEVPPTNEALSQVNAAPKKVQEVEPGIRLRDQLKKERSLKQQQRQHLSSVSGDLIPNQPLPSVTGIRDALRLEAEAIPKKIRFQILKREKVDAFWVLTIKPNDAVNTTIDESLEGAKAWWPRQDGVHGQADILAVIPEEQQIHLRFCTAQPPEKEETIYIYLPRYIDAIIEIWRSSWAERCIQSLRQARAQTEKSEDIDVNPDSFPTLRKGQKAIFHQLGWPISFLWGPPGSGKTYTLGALLASLMVQYPEKKILLLSSTNTAVDLALVSVDNALSQLISEHSPYAAAANIARNRTIRLGNNFRAGHFTGREHLIPAADKKLLDELRQLELEEPSKEDIKNYAFWREARDTLRKKIKAHSLLLLKNNQLSAQTTTRAAFTFEELQQVNYDLIVFDEASQVGIPHALALMPLGKHCLFAGDYKQLAPICISKTPLAREWIGQSMFKYYRKSAEWCCLLDEQSRMAEPISQLISNIFYDGLLRVAEDAQSSCEWRTTRESVANKSPIKILSVSEDFKWSQKYNGPIRHESALALAKFLASISADERNNCVVLTPFRAQRALIKNVLKKEGMGKLNVSTIHRSQGSEYDTVLFDPVDGRHNFFQFQRSLINVALSRAKARLVITLSDADCEEATFKKIRFLTLERPDHSSVTTLTDLQLQANPDQWVGKAVHFRGVTGVFKGCLNQQAIFIDLETGEERKFVI